MRHVLFATVLLLTTPIVQAETPSRRDPLRGSTVFAYEMTLGNSMDRQGDASFRLFDGDTKQTDAFEKVVHAELIQRFAKYGREIEASDSKTARKHNLMIAFYGRPTDLPTCPGSYVFLLKMRVVEQTGPDAWEDTWGHSELGVSESGHLSAAMLKSLQVGLDDLFWYEPVPVAAATPEPQSP